MIKTVCDLGESIQPYTETVLSGAYHMYVFRTYSAKKKLSEGKIIANAMHRNSLNRLNSLNLSSVFFIKCDMEQYIPSDEYLLA